MAGKDLLLNSLSNRKSWTLLVLGFLFLFLFKSSLLHAIELQKMCRLTNNKTFYSSEIPLLKPSQSLMNLQRTFREPISMIFDSIKSKELAEIAKSNARYKKTHSQCFKWVRMALAKWLGDPGLDLNSLPIDHVNQKRERQPLAGRSSEDFIKWAQNNPISLCQNLKLVNATEDSEIASYEGVIHLYKKSSCGFNRRYGHAEILTNRVKGEACSDHCRTISRPCSPDLILAPVTNCDLIGRS